MSFTSSPSPRSNTRPLPLASSSLKRSVAIVAVLSAISSIRRCSNSRLSMCFSFDGDRLGRCHSPDTKPGRMAGLRWFREMPLPNARREPALSLMGRLLPQRLHLSRVWDAREEGVADRRDELRRHTNVRRLLVVVGKADQARFGPAAADEGD